jgi:hypothetical protein
MGWRQQFFGTCCLNQKILLCLFGSIVGATTEYLARAFAQVQDMTPVLSTYQIRTDTPCLATLHIYSRVRRDRGTKRDWHTPLSNGWRFCPGQVCLGDPCSVGHRLTDDDIPAPVGAAGHLSLDDEPHCLQLGFTRQLKVLAILDSSKVDGHCLFLSDNGYSPATNDGDRAIVYSRSVLRKRCSHFCRTSPCSSLLTFGPSFATMLPAMFVVSYRIHPRTTGSLVLRS